MRPFESCNGLPSRVRMIDRNWYSSRFPSTAIVRPRNASRLVGWRTVIGVRRTPMTLSSLHRGLWRSRRRDRGNRSMGLRRKGPRIAVRRDRLEQRQRLGLRKGEEELPDVLAEILAVDQLAPVLAVMEDRPPDRIELDAVVLDPGEDRLAIPRNLDVPRIASLRPVQAVPVHEPPERSLDEGVLRHVGAEVRGRHPPEADLGGGRLLPEGVDPLQGARLVLGLDPEHAEDLDAVLRRVTVEVVVEEAVHGLRLGSDLLDPRHPGFELLFRVA